MILKKRVFERYKDGGLDGLCRKLVDYQLESWQRLKEAYELLKDSKKRVINCNGFSVTVHYNPGRIKNIVADGQNNFLSRDTCFLCHKNLPVEQKGIVWKDYIILVNPSPVFPYHLTICSIVHKPQRINHEIKTIFELSVDFGQDWVMLYNGGRCGASNPHHMHFQAILKGSLPIEKELKDENRLKLISKKHNVSLFRLKDLGREAFLIQGSCKEELERSVKEVLTALEQEEKNHDEPMMNLISFYEGHCIYLIIFPRSKHRPRMFYRKDDPVLVSPAVIEMAGAIITANDKDFERLNRRTVEEIYKEVSLEVSLEGLTESF